MRKTKYEINVGDTLYEASKSYGKVFGYEVESITLERYISDWKVVVQLKPVYNTSWGVKKFLSDVVHMYDTIEAAEQALADESVADVDCICKNEVYGNKL